MEDFFTLTEMKDGLTTRERVQELVNLMQKEKDRAVRNVGEATRQWSTVASTVSITENKECLDLFIELNGLWFFNKWLMDAQKFCNDTNDSFAEESVTALLRAIERMHVQNERLCSSGIWITVKNLLGHKSSSVQDSARTLFDSWKGIQDGNEACHVEKLVAVGGVSNGDEAQFKAEIDRKSGLSACSAKDFKGDLSEVKEREFIRDGNEVKRSLDDLQMKEVAGEQRASSKVQASSFSPTDQACKKNETSKASTGVQTPTQENISIKDGLINVPSEPMTSIKKCDSSNIRQGIDEVMSNLKNVDANDDDCKATSKSKSFQEDAEPTEFLSSLTMKMGFGVSRADASKAEDSTKELTSQTIISVKDVDLFLKSVSHGDAATSTSDAKSGLLLCQAGGGAVDPEITFSHQKDMNPVEEDEDLAIEDDSKSVQEDEEPGSDDDEDMPDLSDILKPTMDSLDSDVIDKKSDIDLEYGYVDALEVARQVAKAVKKEVGKYGEPCSSYSEKMSDRSIEQPSSPESINGKENRSSESQEEEVSARVNASVQAFPRIEANLISSDRIGENKQNNSNTHDIESSQVTEAAQEPQSNAEKNMCNFDLNEACFEDVERPSNPLSSSSTAAVSVVSASRAAAVHGLPVSPLQFEGTLGWKGSAITSAFRAAPPRRNADADKISNESASGSPKRTNNILDIDLNVSEEVDYDTADLILGRQQPVSSGFRSRESSVTPKRPRLMLDLNQTDDDGDVPVSDGRMDRLFSSGRNGHINPSPASSSSSMPPFLKNIDLNDRPTINYALSDQQPHFRKLSSQYGSVYGGQKTEPVISIMGTKVEVDRRDPFPQLMPLMSGKSPDAGMDVFTRNGNFQAAAPLMSYENSSPYGYSGLTPAPPMSFYSPGTPIPYMVDSRGTPIVPQMMGYAPAFPPSYSHHQQFITSMAGAPLPQPLTGAVPLQNNFNLNLGLMSDGMNSRGSRPFFLPSNDSRTTEDYLRPDLQPSSSGIGGKRKELDGGWEQQYPFNMKHHQPPWK